MPFTPVPFPSSKNIASVEHDPDSQVLVVTYSRGHAYRYFPVTVDMADGFGQALSASDYLREFIVGQAVEEKVSDPT
jgi:hypothetical protein